MKVCCALLFVLFCVCEADPEVQLRLTHHGHHGTTNTEDTESDTKVEGSGGCSALHAKLSHLEEKLNQQIAQNVASVAQNVAFSASLTDGASVTLGAATPQTIKFERVLINIGNAYNPHSGYFTAPRKGAYQFTFSTYGGTLYASGAQLVKNGQLQVGTTQPQEEGGSLSGAVILSLNAGDTVSVMTWSNQIIYDNLKHLTTFSGVLLFPL